MQAVLSVAKVLCLENGDSPWTQDKGYLLYSPFPEEKMGAMERGVGVRLGEIGLACQREGRIQCPVSVSIRASIEMDMKTTFFPAWQDS